MDTLQLHITSGYLQIFYRNMIFECTFGIHFNK